MDIQREGHELIVERTGSRRLADVTLYCVIAGAIATSLMAVGGLLYTLNRFVIEPLLKILPDVEWQDAVGNPAVVSALVTLLLFMLVGAAVWRWFTGWNKVLHLAIDSYVGTVRDRVKHLEEHTCSLESALDVETTIKRQLIELDTRITKLESKSDHEVRGKVSPEILMKALAGDMLVIRSARYGVLNGKWADATQAVRNLVKQNRSLDFKVSNDNLGGDPIPGQHKQLEISYTQFGQEHTKTWDEKSLCQIP